MSIATKRKHVTREVTGDLILPKDGQQIVRIVAGRGNNLHEVEDEQGRTFLVSMPPKFRRTVWVKRGDFVMCEPIEEGDKVQAEIVNILYKDNIAYICDNGMWPSGFVIDNKAGAPTSSSNEPEQFISSDLLPPSASESESDDDDEDGESEGEGDEDDSDPESHIEVCNPNRGRGLFSADSAAKFVDDSSNNHDTLTGVGIGRTYEKNVDDEEECPTLVAGIQAIEVIR